MFDGSQHAVRISKFEHGNESFKEVRTFCPWYYPDDAVGGTDIVLLTGKRQSITAIEQFIY